MKRKRPVEATIISIVAIIYGVLEIVEFLFISPVITEKKIIYTIPFLGTIFLLSGVGTLALKEFGRMGMIIGCMIAIFYSGQAIYRGGLPEGIFLHVVFIIVYVLVIFYFTRPGVAVSFKKTSLQQCFNHPEIEAKGICRYCGRHLCSECMTPGGSCKDASDCMAYKSAEYIEPRSMLEDSMAIPQEVMEIISDYGETLDMLAEERSGRLLHPLSKLPHPKEKIENALKTALGIVKSQEMRNHLETVLLALEDFVPDNEVPEDPEENMKAWIRRKDWKDPKQRNQLARILTRFFVEKYGENAEQELQAFLREMGPRKEKNI